MTMNPKVKYILLPILFIIVIIIAIALLPVLVSNTTGTKKPTDSESRVFFPTATPGVR
jgi:hypothetical protein